MAEYPDSYAKDGYGALYVTAAVDDYTLGEYYSGRITADEFLAEVRVKFGESRELAARQGEYRKCDVGQTHFWLFCFYPRKRQAAGKCFRAVMESCY